MNAVAQGGVEVPNPFNRQIYRVSLKPEDVAAVVFWTKNIQPFRKNLKILLAKGFDKLIFNYTITSLPKNIFEPNVPPAEKSAEYFIELSRQFGKEAVIWRYDPILFTDVTDEIHYLDNFNRLADKIALYTDTCIFSFAYFYKKVIRSLQKLESESGMKSFDPEITRKRELAERLAILAESYGLKFQACCCDYLLEVPGVTQAHCIDGELISRLWSNKLVFREQPSREGCGCAEASDIGEYGSCKGGCVYCYAS